MRETSLRAADRNLYVVSTLALSLGSGFVIANVAGAPGAIGAATLGAVVAWVVQAASFWKLAGAMLEGRSAMGPWAGGMAARGGGLLLVWLLAGRYGEGGRVVAVAYGLTLLVFLLLEAWVLWRGSTR
ncbi:MAG: hypothetical protein V3U67_08365 [Gemmatimonadota bacterium]